MRFEHGDLTDWTPVEPVDVVFANASLRWVPDHPAVLGSLVTGLATSGQIAFQVPANHDHPAHTIAAEPGAELGLAPVGPAAYNHFETRYHQRLKDRLGDRPYFYAFKRIVAWARRA